jgi:hypothetical protein
MGYPIQTLTRSALRILIAWLLAVQPMTGAYAASATVGTPLSMELCRGTVLDQGAPDQDAPAGKNHAADCCLAGAPTPAPPPQASAELSVPKLFSAAIETQVDVVFVATAGLGPQSARAPPL